MKFKLSVLFLIFSMFFATKIFAITENVKDTNLREMFQNNQAVIYSVNLRTFNAKDLNGNGIIDFSLGETSGSFVNSIERLDELKELGINTVQLLPITPTGKIKALGTAGSLYALSDFQSLNEQLSDINSELSTKEQAKLFIDECHKRGMKVIVDLPSCGAYDLFINRPELFKKYDDDSAVIPADWTDVRLFDIPNNESLLKSDIFVLHKMFVRNMINLGVDGISATVATIKPSIFWAELIKYARTVNPNFLFIAEVSKKNVMPQTKEAYYTDTKKLLDSGFDGYYGNYFDLKEWGTMKDLKTSISNQQKLLNKYSVKKSVMGSFVSHDVISPLITGGENYSKIIIWLNATLPINPHYIDGFLQADDYIYNYSNKKAPETYTDDDYYYVHQGQIDIFNFSRKPSSDTDVLINEQKVAMKVRNEFLDVITNGKFMLPACKNQNIFAYQRILKGKSVVTIINRNLVNSEEINIKIKNISKKSKIDFVKRPNDISIIKSTISGRLKPAEILVFTVQ